MNAGFNGSSASLTHNFSKHKGAFASYVENHLMKFGSL